MISLPRSTPRRTWLAALAILLMFGSLGALSRGSAPLDGHDRFVRNDGSLHFSRAATEGLVHLGSWFVPEGEAAGFHHVYTQPEAIEAFRDSGRFPDGTALVKEIVSDRRADYTTGTDVASATETRQWFVMIKAEKARFEGNPLWGEGWGWALFLGEDPATNVAVDFRSDCLGCHLPARDTDLVYTAGYPVLARRARSAAALPSDAAPVASSHALRRAH